MNTNDLGTFFSNSKWGPVLAIVGVFLIAGLIGGRVADWAKWLGIAALAVFALGFFSGNIQVSTIGGVTVDKFGNVGGTGVAT